MNKRRIILFYFIIIFGFCFNFTCCVVLNVLHCQWENQGKPTPTLHLPLPHTHTRALPIGLTSCCCCFALQLPAHDTDADNAGSAATSTLRCLLNGPFRDLHFNIADHHHRSIIPVHDVVFIDDIECNVKPLIYRPVLAETLPVTSTSTTKLTEAAADSSSRSR